MIPLMTAGIAHGSSTTTLSSALPSTTWLRSRATPSPYSVTAATAMTANTAVDQSDRQK